MEKTHTCYQLGPADAGREVTLAGWIDSVRDLGGIIFVNLRDRDGITQIYFDRDDIELYSSARELKPESVVSVSGTIVKRKAGTENPKMKTGEIELWAKKLVVFNVSQPLPFSLGVSADQVREDLRLTYRYLDLRKPTNLNSLKIRHKAARSIRAFLDENEFIEIETPILFKSTPEGAREFLVPSRLNPAHFYSLTQSPQQYKQMLMVAGVERYYQLARCFRDQDKRTDRQPEFTQVDIEMSFIDREDIFFLVEGLLKRVWRDILDIEIHTPFIRMSYFEVMEKYGADNPDLRYEGVLVDLSDLFKRSAFKVFSQAALSGQVVKAINIKGLADLTAGELRTLENTARELGAKGLVSIRVKGGDWKSFITKFLSEEERAALTEALRIEDGDLIFFSSDEWERACKILGRIRLDAMCMLTEKGRLAISATDLRFLWVIDFPLVTFKEEQGRFVSTHHPFTAPLQEDIHLLDSSPYTVRGQHYDCVLNGVELGGGSIRIHNSDLQEKIFRDVLGFSDDIIKTCFGYMLGAFRYGAPPHGGIAFGFDRLASILAGRNNIRDVIAFPKNQRGQDLMTGSPGTVTNEQLIPLHISLVEKLDI